MSRERTSQLRAFTGTERRRRFGRYETLFRIAGGGMAEVYAARIMGEAGFEKVVALKRMLPTLAEDDRFVDMFLDEGRLAANISSPHVVQTMDLGRAEDDSLYLVMELVVGVPLSKLLREVLRGGEQMETEVAIEVIAQAALGLHDAHEATTPMGEPMHIVHRDVSPQNILVDRTGRTRILDFGVARAIQRSSHTQTGEVKGKMAYFAPEQATGAPLDRRVDIFALGTVAWEALTGRRLFKTENPLHTLQKITQDPIPTILEVRPNMDPKLSAVIEKALQRDPDGRYDTAREFAQALRSCTETRVAPARIGEYVKANGGEALEKLERGLKLALSGHLEADTDRPPALGDLDRPISQSQIVLTGTGTPATLPAGIGGSKVQLIAGIAIVLVAALVGGGMALMGDPEPEEPATAPVVEAPPEEPIAQVEPETTMEAVTETEVEAETETETETETEVAAAPTMRRWTGMRRRPGTMATMTTTESMETMATATMATATMTDMTAMTAMTATMDEPTMDTSSRMVLRGIDDFDSH